MHYITIFQNDHKDQTHDVYFCQWSDERKAELLTLFEFLANFVSKFDGDYGEGYSFSYNLGTIPESAVNALSGIYTAGPTGVEFNKHDDNTPESKQKYDQFLNFMRQTMQDYLRWQGDE
jgi:hypothetical protein